MSLQFTNLRLQTNFPGENELLVPGDHLAPLIHAVSGSLSSVNAELQLPKSIPDVINIHAWVKSFNKHVYLCVLLVKVIDFLLCSPNGIWTFEKMFFYSAFKINLILTRHM